MWSRGRSWEQLLEMPFTQAAATKSSSRARCRARCSVRCGARCSARWGATPPCKTLHPSLALPHRPCPRTLCQGLRPGHHTFDIKKIAKRNQCRDHIRSSLKDNSHCILKSSFGSLTIVKDICMKYIKYIILGCLWEQSGEGGEGKPTLSRRRHKSSVWRHQCIHILPLQEISAFFFEQRTLGALKDNKSVLTTTPFFNLLQYFTGPTPVHN